MSALKRSSCTVIRVTDHENISIHIQYFPFQISRRSSKPDSQYFSVFLKYHLVKIAKNSEIIKMCTKGEAHNLTEKISHI